MSSHYCDKIDSTALAASAPFFFLILAWAMLRHVIIPLPIGFLFVIDKCIIALVDAWDIKSKWGVSPLITQPNAIKASNFFIDFGINFRVLSKRPLAMS